MKNEIINYLIDIKAIQINTKKLFNWSSKIQSPIYIDNRLIMSYPIIRTRISEELAILIKNSFPKVDYLVGVATSGIPHCAYLSSQLNLPMAYFRNSQKQHGKENSIEGDLTKAKNIIIIEDLFSTGNSALKAYQFLKNNNFNVIGIVSIFSYNLNILKKTFKNIENKSLININDLIEVSIKNNILNNEDIQIIKDFLQRINSKIT